LPFLSFGGSRFRCSALDIEGEDSGPGSLCGHIKTLHAVLSKADFRRTQPFVMRRGIQSVFPHNETLRENVGAWRRASSSSVAPVAFVPEKGSAVCGRGPPYRVREKFPNTRVLLAGKEVASATCGILRHAGFTARASSCRICHGQPEFYAALDAFVFPSDSRAWERRCKPRWPMVCR